MRLETLLPLVLLGSLAPGCGDTETNPIVPFVDEWREGEETLQLPYSAEGGYAVSTLRIGGLGVGDNFFNRGDIVVLYDSPGPEMVIDVRRFTQATDEAAAEEDFGRLQLWLSDANFDQPPRVPDLGDSRCDVGMWRDGCGIRTWFDGQEQKLRAGMDLRVHLPPDFLAQLDVTTEDNDTDEDYLRHGDVCLWNAPASVKVNLQRGEALVKMADDLVATPTCSEADIAACDAAQWAQECPCIAKGQTASTVSIEGRTSDIAVSLPSSTFASVTLENRGTDQDPEGDHCLVEIDVPGADLEPSDFAWKQRGVIAPRGNATYALAISAFSDECASVHHVETPEMYEPGGAGQLDPRRGDITVCDGCIQNQSCDDFLEDGLRLSN